MNHTTQRVRWPTLLRDPLSLAACGFGAGALPRAPGTFGSLLALPIFYFVHTWPPVAYLALVLVLFVIGVGLCAHAARRFGVADHPAIVWDEIVGMLITLTLAPPDWRWCLVGFALFRLFDIWKPFPIRWLDRHVHGGFGIMLDDAVAGLYAGALLYVMVWLWMPN